MIIPALSSKAVWKVLYLFSFAPGKGLNRKEIKELTKLGNNPLDNSLRSLLFFSVLEKKGNAYRLRQIPEILELLNIEKEKARNISYDIWNLLFDFCLKIKSLNIGKVILFGSYAKGIASIHSDIDLCIILKKKSINEELRIRETSEKFKNKFKKKIHIHFFEEKEFEKGKLELMKEIKKDGIFIIGF